MIVAARKISGSITLVILMVFFISSCTTEKIPNRILVFSKTVGFRHIDAIEAGIPALLKIGMEKGFIVDTTEDAADFNEQNLKRYRAVIFLNASGEVFDAGQRTAFQRYIQAGGGFLAIHAPTDAERQWPWYGQLIGGYFRSHPADPNIQKGTYQVEIKDHPATDSLPARFEREDEFYDFDIVDTTIKVLITIDEKTYKGGKTGDHHPAVWYHNFDGGRSFYTAMGHTTESYSDPYFLSILKGGISYVTGNEKDFKLDYSRSVPEENRFDVTVLMEKLDEPMHLAIAKDGKIFFAQRRGEIFLYDEEKKQSKLVGTIPVSAKYEDGLLGITMDPDFVKNQRLYVYYTAPGGKAFHISRYTLSKEGLLDLGSEKILLKIPKDILDGSHTGGGLIFDPKGTGNLFITVGDNSSPRNWGYAPTDERKGREDWDAQRSSGNTNDLRGKILRIHPEEDGTYTVPAGNLFAKGLARTRPEIFSMGHRQPWRIAIDSKTGWLYVGEVGPDANDDSSSLGPKGYDEFNQIRQAGNFGWPYFIANNKPYADYDFQSGKTNGFFDPAKPVNHSANNTGLQELPAANPAFIWYPYGSSKEFPLTGNGGRSATGGPLFHQADFKKGTNTFPDYYEGKWFIADWIRGWMNVVSIDEKGNYVSMESFLPGHSFSNPIDIQFGPDGSMYMLEYGKGWFRANDDARLIKITYNKGNRAPIAKLSIDKKSGAIPFTVQLSSKGSVDYDADGLSYQWQIKKGDKNIQSSDEPNPAITLTEVGIYTVVLTVKDAKGASSEKQTEIVAGNEPPKVAINIRKGNSSFYFTGTSIGYEVTVTDKEDDHLKNVKPAFVTIEYIAGGYKKVLLGDPDPTKPDQTVDGISIYGGMVLNSSDCYSCHSIEKKSAGPSFREVAEKYSADRNAGNYLAQKIIHGGSGVWGEAAMSAHPDLDPAKAKEMSNFILSLSTPVKPSLPLQGEYTLTIPAEQQTISGQPENDKGAFVMKAVYTDNSAGSVPSQTSENEIVLRNPALVPGNADILHDIMKVNIPSHTTELAVFSGFNPYVGFKSIDLVGVRQVFVNTSSSLGGIIEIRIDAPDGKIIGKSEVIAPGKGSFSPGPAVPIKVDATTGKHDVYFVVKGTAVTKRSDIVFIITRMLFSNK